MGKRRHIQRCSCERSHIIPLFIYPLQLAHPGKVNVEKITPYVEHPIPIKITTEKEAGHKAF